MVIDQLVREGARGLSENKYTNPQLESRLILSILMEVDKSYLYAHGSDEIPVEIQEKFRDWIRKRQDGYPLQYLIGSQEFMGMDFKVREGVLIPRADTEILVENIISYVKDRFGKSRFNLLDLGIGSGAISLSVAKYCPQGNIHGVDLYDVPLMVAEENRKNHGLANVKYHKGDLFSPFEDKEWEGYFDIIVSNPPYIPSGEMETLQKEVKDHEPHTALEGGEDGLGFYRRITKESVRYLKEGGLLIYETGHDQGEAIAEIMKSYGFTHVEVINDLENRNRVVRGRRARSVGFVDFA